MPPSADAHAPPPQAVLDTNVVLDWLVFKNPECIRIGDAIEQGALRWMASQSLRDELAHVIQRGFPLDAWGADARQLWAHWDRLAQHQADAALTLVPPVRCTDPDDQKFLNLALAHGARWLVSRDRAVLKTARRARALGLEVVHPCEWHLPAPA